MVSKDFENGGFPINKRCPVLCYTEDGRLFVAYDNFKLKAILDQSTVVKCVGIWPGKYNTDIFRLLPEHYGKYLPPEQHQEIDNADNIRVTLDKDENLLKIEYIMRTDRIVSKDPKLYDYIIKAGRPHKVGHA